MTWATGSVLTEPAASSRMEMSEDRESAHYNHSLEDEGGDVYAGLTPDQFFPQSNPIS